MAAPRNRNSSRKSGGNGDFTLTDQPGHLLRRCQQRAVDIFVEAVAPSRITPRQFAILLTLERQPGLTQTELVAATGIDRSTVGDMIDRLTGRGLIRRERSGDDQRANTLALMPAGKTMLRRAQPAVMRAQHQIIAPVPPALRSGVIAALRLMAGVPASTPASRRRRGA